MYNIEGQYADPIFNISAHNTGMESTRPMQTSFYAESIKIHRKCEPYQIQNFPNNYLGTSNTGFQLTKPTHVEGFISRSRKFLNTSKFTTGVREIRAMARPLVHTS